jgi:hypothetical protein
MVSKVKVGELYQVEQRAASARRLSPRRQLEALQMRLSRSEGQAAVGAARPALLDGA